IKRPLSLFCACFQAKKVRRRQLPVPRSPLTPYVLRVSYHVPCRFAIGFAWLTQTFLKAGNAPPKTPWESPAAAGRKPFQGVLSKACWGAPPPADQAPPYFSRKPAICFWQPLVSTAKLWAWAAPGTRYSFF